MTPLLALIALGFLSAPSPVSAAQLAAGRAVSPVAGIPAIAVPALGVVPEGLSLSALPQSLPTAGLAPVSLAAPLAPESAYGAAARVAELPAAFALDDLRSLMGSVPSPSAGGYFGNGGGNERRTGTAFDDEDHGAAGSGVRVPRSPKPMPPAARALRIPRELVTEGGARLSRVLNAVFDGGQPAKDGGRVPVRETELALAH